jgi:hypothetical protein
MTPEILPCTQCRGDGFIWLHVSGKPRRDACGTCAERTEIEYQTLLICRAESIAA